MDRSRLLILALSFVLTACAAGASGEANRPPRPNLNRISAEEFQTRSHDSAYEALRVLRPNWLQQRGQPSITNPRAGQIVVYLDGARVGSLDFLRQIRAADVASMERLNAAEAASRFGLDHSGGAILVVTRRR